MSGRFFLDTNILVYAVDASNPTKQTKAIQLVVEAHQSGQGIVSYQVVQEWFSVMIRKGAVLLEMEQALPVYRRLIEPLWRIQSSRQVLDLAIELQVAESFSWWDSLVISAAIHGGCDRLLSEDLQDGREIRGLLISNPFA